MPPNSLFLPSPRPAPRRCGLAVLHIATALILLVPTTKQYQALVLSQPQYTSDTIPPWLLPIAGCHCRPNHNSLRTTPTPSSRGNPALPTQAGATQLLVLTAPQEEADSLDQESSTMSRATARPPMVQLLGFCVCLSLVHPGQAVDLRQGRGSFDTTTAPQARAGQVPIWKTNLAAALALVGDGRDRSWLRAPPGNGTGADPSSQSGGSSRQMNTNSTLSNTSSGVSRPQQGTAPTSITINVYINRGRYNINPMIYGVNEYWGADWTAFKNAGIRFVRKGGNAESRYNWAVDANNRAQDWFFQSLPNSQPGQKSSFDSMVEANKANGIATLATIPVLQWLPKQQAVGCSFSVRKYGTQQRQAPDVKDCGNGYYPNGQRINNNPADVSVYTDASHQTAWVQSLVKKYGTAKKGGVRYYCMDNEPVWWSYNHWDIHRESSSYDEIVQRSLTFAPAVKKADPSAMVLGPVTGGWSDTFFSIRDMQAGWSTYPYKYWSNPVDRKAHGNKPFLQYYLEQMKAYEQKTGKRAIDVVDIHAYVVPVNDNSDPNSQAQRIEGVRVLWDPKYTCSFCDWVDPITAPDGVPRFISRVKQIIRSTYPGVGLAVSEYNFGGTKDISGAIAQAEALGIFGRTGVAMASVFPNPQADTTVYQAFKMFGNFDNSGSKFGSIGVQAVSSSSRDVSTYAAMDSKTNRLTTLIINQKPATAQVTVNLNDINPTKRISAYQYSSANLRQIVGLPSINPAKNVRMTIPGYSLTMLVVPL